MAVEKMMSAVSNGRVTSAESWFLQDIVETRPAALSRGSSRSSPESSALVLGVAGISLPRHFPSSADAKCCGQPDFDSPRTIRAGAATSMRMGLAHSNNSLFGRGTYAGVASTRRRLPNRQKNKDDVCLHDGLEAGIAAGVTPRAIVAGCTD